MIQSQLLKDLSTEPSNAPLYSVYLCKIRGSGEEDKAILEN